MPQEKLSLDEIHNLDYYAKIGVSEKGNDPEQQAHLKRVIDILKEDFDTVGVKQCFSCHNPLDVKKGYIVLCLCEDCIKNPQNTTARLVIKQWGKKK